jgi:hypothetical protein
MPGYGARSCRHGFYQKFVYVFIIPFAFNTILPVIEAVASGRTFLLNKQEACTARAEAGLAHEEIGYPVFTAIAV